jgi:hypothetical protein
VILSGEETVNSLYSVMSLFRAVADAFEDIRYIKYDGKNNYFVAG